MDDVKDKMKGFMKKVNNPFSSSSSGKFKGQGRVLGSSSSSSSTPAPSSHPLVSRASPASPNPRSQRTSSPQQPTTSPAKPNSDGAFSPYESFISSGKRPVNGVSVELYECPVCSRSFASEEDVSAHVETCLSDNADRELNVGSFEGGGVDARVSDGLALTVASYLSGSPSDASADVVLKLLRNVVKEPENTKFRRVRMGNPKIKEAVGDVKGGIELLESVGFSLGEEEGEIWATMAVPEEDQLSMIRKVVTLLNRRKEEEHELEPSSNADVERLVEPKKIDRQVRVFFLIPESVPEKIELPDSFYSLSSEEIRREAELRRKKLSESQLLIPKSYKDKQLKAARRKYKATIIRIQFPDGVLLQGVFLPWETTTSLYEFVSSALKDPSLEFELLQPALHRRRVISRLPISGGRPPSLEEEDLVPSALVKFKPIETDSNVFTGLSNQMLEASEPLKAVAL